jgi:hypothetical protein
MSIQDSEIVREQRGGRQWRANGFGMRVAVAAGRESAVGQAIDARRRDATRQRTRAARRSGMGRADRRAWFVRSRRALRCARPIDVPVNSPGVYFSRR